MPSLLLLLSLAAAPQLSTSTEPDGLDLVILRPAHPDCTARLVVRAGAARDPTGKTGLAHLVEHLAFGGEQGRALAFRSGLDVNAHTSVDGTVFELSAPAERCEDALTRFLATVTDGKLRRVWFEKEIEVINREAVERPLGLGSLLDQGLFGNDDNRVIGTRTTREAIHLADTRRFFQDHYVPENMALLVSSALGPDEVRRALAKGLKLAPSLPTERRQPEAHAVKSRGERTFAHVPPGVILGTVVLPGVSVEACASAAALLELRLRAAVGRGTTSLEGGCSLDEGNLVLSLLVIGADRNHAALHDAVAKQLKDLAPMTGAERQALERRFENEAALTSASPDTALEALARAAQWSRGDALFEQLSSWLTPRLVPDAELAGVRKVLAAKDVLLLSGDAPPPLRAAEP